MKMLFLASALVATSLVIANAPAMTVPATIKTGMIVRDMMGDQVGLVDKLEGTRAVVATGQHRIVLPLSAFAVGSDGAMIAMTKGELDAAAERARSMRYASLRDRAVPGAKLLGAKGQTLGTVETLTPKFLVLKTARGDVRLPISAVTLSSGSLQIGLSAAEFEAVLSARKGV